MATRHGRADRGVRHQRQGLRRRQPPGKTVQREVDPGQNSAEHTWSTPGRNQHENDLPRSAKAEKIQEAFREWLFRDDDPRTARRPVQPPLQRPTRTALRRQPSELPRHVRVFEPHPYQRDAVARILHEPTVLADDVVGAGKSARCSWRRWSSKPGLVRQPWIVAQPHHRPGGPRGQAVVPGRPRAMGSAGTDAEGRRRLIAQSAQRMGHGHRAVQRVHADRRLGRVAATIRREHARGSAGADGRQRRYHPQKQENDRAGGKQAKARLEELTEQAGKDTGLRFEDSGADYLFIDETRLFKNLPRVSGVAELACTGLNIRPQDLDLKLQVLRQAAPKKQRAPAGAARPLSGSPPSPPAPRSPTASASCG